MQAAIVTDLVRAGVAIHAFNQRDIAGILAMIRTVGALVGAADRADRLATGYEQRLSGIAAGNRPSRRPKVYFEEWDDPLISGIGWVSELIEIAGGEDVLPELRFHQAAKDRIISPDLVRQTAPDVILASWCGKKVVPNKIRKRPGWGDIPAVRNNRIAEIKSSLILQPGPAALTDGLDAIMAALWPSPIQRHPPEGSRETFPPCVDARTGLARVVVQKSEAGAGSGFSSERGRAYLNFWHCRSALSSMPGIPCDCNLSSLIKMLTERSGLHHPSHND